MTYEMTADSPTLTIARLSRLLESHGTTDLSLPQYRVLGLLSGGDERASQLAGRLTVAKPTLTSLIDSLVEREFVARESSDGDRRAVRLSITDAGREALQRTEQQLARVLDEVVERCEHPAVVRSALDELRHALDQRWDAIVAQQAATSAGGTGR
jgi:DNA-binding MarR family transcriptional regulator